MHHAALQSTYIMAKVWEPNSSRMLTTHFACADDRTWRWRHTHGRQESCWWNIRYIPYRLDTIYRHTHTHTQGSTYLGPFHFPSSCISGSRFGPTFPPSYGTSRHRTVVHPSGVNPRKRWIVSHTVRQAETAGWPCCLAWWISRSIIFSTGSPSLHVGCITSPLTGADSVICIHPGLFLPPFPPVSIVFSFPLFSFSSLLRHHHHVVIKNLLYIRILASASLLYQYTVGLYRYQLSLFRLFLCQVGRPFYKYNLSDRGWLIAYTTDRKNSHVIP